VQQPVEVSDCPRCPPSGRKGRRVTQDISFQLLSEQQLLVVPVGKDR